MLITVGVAAWLLKTEPETYGWGDLVRDGETTWDGVKNPAAKKNLRAMRPGDLLVIYHTGGERAAVGLGMVVRPGDPDPVICAREPLPRPVTLDSIKSSKAFKNSPLVRQGRLSVVPLDAGQLGELGRLSGA